MCHTQDSTAACSFLATPATAKKDGLWGHERMKILLARRRLRSLYTTPNGGVLLSGRLNQAERSRLSKLFS